MTVSLTPFSSLTAKIFAGLFVTTLGFAAVQTVRIDGLWFIDGLQEQLGGMRSALKTEQQQRADERADWRRQVAAAQAAKAAAELTSKEIATSAQVSHDALLADNAGLREYIAAHRLPLAAAADRALAAGTREDHDAGVPAAASADALVATSEADLVTCDADFSYAASAFAWAEHLIETGLAQ